MRIYLREAQKVARDSDGAIVSYPVGFVNAPDRLAHEWVNRGVAQYANDDNTIVEPDPEPVEETEEAIEPITSDDAPMMEPDDAQDSAD